MSDVLVAAGRLRADRTPYVLATVVRTERPASAQTGDRALVLPDGTLEGFVGGTCAASTVRMQALRLLESGESTLLRITPAPSAAEVPGMVSVTNPCLSGGTLDIFLETVLPPALVEVYGEGPIARALAEVGSAAGYSIRTGASVAAGLAADTTAVVVAAHGRDEEPVLAAALAADVPYIGLIASRRRGAAVVKQLEGGDRIHTPAGLDIGARTPSEIALSVFAEILSMRPRRHPQAPVTAVTTDPPVTAVATDPVCGMEVAIGPSTIHFEGAYFCGTGCRDAYAADSR